MVPFSTCIFLHSVIQRKGTHYLPNLEFFFLFFCLFVVKIGCVQSHPSKPNEFSLSPNIRNLFIIVFLFFFFFPRMAAQPLTYLYSLSIHFTVCTVTYIHIYIHRVISPLTNLSYPVITYVTSAITYVTSAVLSYTHT